MLLRMYFALACATYEAECTCDAGHHVLRILSNRSCLSVG